MVVMKNKIGIFLNKMLEGIKTILFGVRNKKISLICFALLFLSSTLLLIAGSQHSSANLYKSSSYFANLVQSKDDVDNIGFVVKQKEKDSILPDTASELRSLYGAFGNRKSNYAGTVNAEKKQSITYEDYEINNNFSFVYVQTGVQVSVSSIHPDRYRMEFYPLDLMFEHYPNSAKEYFSFMYISTEQARVIIDYKHPGLFDKNTSIDELLKDDAFVQKCKEEILGKGINLNFDGVVKEFQVTNIYYAEDYFYRTVYNTIGEFFVGYNQYPDGFAKEATYFLNDNEYQNNFYLKYIKQAYSTEKYSFGAVNKNINEDFDNTKAFKFVENQYSFIFALLLIFSILSLATSYYLLFKYRIFNVSFCFYSLLSFLIPYFIGKIIYLLSKNIVFFSPFYSIAILVSILGISLFYIGYFVLQKHKNKEVF